MEPNVQSAPGANISLQLSAMCIVARRVSKAAGVLLGNPQFTLFCIIVNGNTLASALWPGIYDMGHPGTSNTDMHFYGRSWRDSPIRLPSPRIAAKRCFMEQLGVVFNPVIKDSVDREQIVAAWPVSSRHVPPAASPTHRPRGPQ